MKRACAVVLSLVIIVCLAGCNIKNGDYNAVKSAFENTLKLKSGKMAVSSNYSKSDNSSNTKTDFSFMTNEDNSYSYCQTQFDMDKKAIYCEYSDGTKVMQWLIGNGWSDSTAAVATKSSPHRFLNLLSTAPEKAALESLSSKKDGDSTVYTAVYKPSYLNDKLYKDTEVELLSQTDTYTVDKDGRLIIYASKASIKDKSINTTCGYELNIAITDQDTVTSVKKPDLRDNYTKKS